MKVPYWPIDILYVYIGDTTYCTYGSKLNTVKERSFVTVAQYRLHTFAITTIVAHASNTRRHHAAFRHSFLRTTMSSVGAYI